VRSNLSAERLELLAALVNPMRPPEET